MLSFVDPPTPAYEQVQSALRKLQMRWRKGVIMPTETTKITEHEGKKYLREIRDATDSSKSCLIDVYAVLVAFNVTCPARQHALKKLLCAGQRSKGTGTDDLLGVQAAVPRAIELERNRNAISPEVTEARRKGYDGIPCVSCGSLWTVCAGSICKCADCQSDFSVDNSQRK